MPKLKILRDEIVFEGQYMRAIKRHFIGRTGKLCYWETMERKTYGRIVGVIGVTQKEEIVLVKSYRVPLKSYVLELCAGLIDHKKEREEKAARREFLEETGYQAKKIERLVSGPFDTGRAGDEMVIFLATNIVKTKNQSLEEAEDIEVVKIPFKKAYQTLTNPPRNLKIDIKLFGVLYLLRQRGYNI